jgi:dGTPase
MIQSLYRHYSDHPEEMPGEYLNLVERGEARERVICDYIAGMTDQYSMEKFSELFIPKSWQVR